MAFVPKKEYSFSEEDEKKVFNLILKNTIEKEIDWELRNSGIYRGVIGNDTILFYRGETRTAISIQNKTEFAFFIINKEQDELLRNVIAGRTRLELDNPANIAKNLWSGKTFFELSKANEGLATTH